ncbi:MAG: hypothetical protein AAF662_03900 [Pseudomonadota bacterium]
MATKDFFTGEPRLQQDRAQTRDAQRQPQPAADLFERQVRLLGHQQAQPVELLVAQLPLRTAAVHHRGDRTPLTTKTQQLADPRAAHPEHLRKLAAAPVPTVVGRDHPLPQVHRIGRHGKVSFRRPL